MKTIPEDLLVDVLINFGLNENIFIKKINYMIKKVNHLEEDNKNLKNELMRQNILIQELKSKDCWTDINDEYPNKLPFLYKTKNNKINICSKRLPDEWYVQKYNITHWMYPNE